MITALSVSLIIVSVLELVFIKENYCKGRYITKPLLVPLIICTYISATSSINYMIITALIFCLIGDILLLGPDRSAAFFNAGLVSFLAGHVTYIYAFIASAGTFQEISLYYYLFLLPFVLGFLLFYIKLGNKLDSMKIPVMIYAGIIIIMSFASLARGYNVAGYQFWCPFAGSILFLISDFSIAHNRFIKNTGGSSVLIMSTYILAQTLIMLGFIN